MDSKNISKFVKKFYTTEVEKNPKNHLSLSKRRQKWICLPPVQEKMESRDCAHAYFLRIAGKVYYKLPDYRFMYRLSLVDKGAIEKLF